VKAFGIPFLALPRSEAAAAAKESPASMQIGMGILAAGCVALGLGATWFVRLFDPITSQALGLRVSSSLIAANGLAMAAGTGRGGTVSTAGIAVLGLALGGIVAILVRLRSRGARRVSGPTWDCGLPGLTADNQYTATAFSKPLRMIFSALYRPRREIQAEYEVSPYYPTAMRFESDIEPTFEKRFYDPLQRSVLELARRMRGIQAGSIHAYLTYIFVTLILLLLFGVRG
jgi:hydrogenase-4 component B